jgi:hypothetical protein
LLAVGVATEAGVRRYRTYDAGTNRQNDGNGSPPCIFNVVRSA